MTACARQDEKVIRQTAFFLSLVLIFAIPWEDAINLPVLGSLARVLGLAGIGIWVLSVLVTGRIRRLNAFHAAVFAFLVWNVATGFWSLAADTTIERLKTYLQLFGLIWLLWDLYDTPVKLRAGLQAYIFGCYVAAGSTVYNYLTGVEFRAYSGGRYASAGTNPNDLALILALGLPVALHLATSVDNRRKTGVLRLVNMAYLPSATVAILLTGTRTSLFAVIPALFYLLITAGQFRPGKRVLVLVLLLVVAFGGYLLLPQTTLDRLATTGSSITEGDLGGRGALWQQGLQELAEHPFTGVGSGAFQRAELGETVIHNTFLSVLVEDGPIGFILFGIIVIIVAVRALHQPMERSVLWMSVFLIWGIGVFTLTWEYRKVTWLLLSLIIISAELEQQRNVFQGRINARSMSIKLPTADNANPRADEPISRGNQPIGS